MIPSGIRRSRAFLAIAILLGSSTAALAQVGPAPQLIPGRNVNMAGGSQIIQVTPFQVRGDVLGRAQNEPSCAISTRNPQHILCGANDYRMVDVPGVTQTQIIRDAWLGEFQSTDGGDTWESRLAGGFFLDPARHPIKQLGYTAAADPVVRSGVAGLTFYAGIAFKADKSQSALHVTTYVDVNNRENDDMPFKPVRTIIVAQASGAKFVDKPWMYVEANPPGQTCSIVVPSSEPTPAGWTETRWARLLAGWLLRFPGWTPTPFVVQRVPASTVHLVYTVFLDPNDSTADMMYTRSDNCGQTFTTPVKLNPTAQKSVGLNEHGNGAAIAKPLVLGSQRVYAVWRRVRLVTGATVLPDAIMGVVSNNNGKTWSAPTVVAQICPFDQGTSATTFRTTAFPTMTADATGRVYVAWSDRQQPDGTCQRTPTGSTIGAARIRVATSTNGTTWTTSEAVPSPTPEHQITPALAFNAGRLFLAWIDFAEDAANVFGQFINETDAIANVPALRHTGDVRASMALPGAAPNFANGATMISEYLKGVVTVGAERIVGQLQWNAVNRRWARKGTVPFNGDYIDIATMPYLAPDPSAGRPNWTPNNQATMTTPLGPVPTSPNILLAWSDNRDMRAAPGVDDLNAPVPYQTPAGLTLPAMSAYDPTQVRPVCLVAADAAKTGTMNQNAYVARASIGFVAAAPGNNKSLGTLQRAFVIYLRNDTTAAKSFRLIAAPPPGGFASFHQFVTSKTTLDVVVPKRSSLARTVYVKRNPQAGVALDPNAVVRVDVIELVGATPVQASSVLLNMDASAPEIEAPEIEAREIYIPEIEALEVQARTAGAPEIEAPEIEAPEIEAPEIEALAWKSLGLARPEIEAPEIEALELEAPEIEAPEIEAQAITDVKFTITNTGNTTAQYNAKAFITTEAGTDFRYQVIVRRRYELPAVDANCEPTTIALSKVAVNLPDVQLGTPEIEAPEIEAPEIEAAGIATFYLEPGAKAEVIIRARSASGAIVPEDAVDLAVDPPVDSDDADLGITKSETVTTYLTVATPGLPAARVGVAYSSQLEASGEVGGLTWALASGSLPPGLGLDVGGLISGLPTTAGTYTFRVQVVDGRPETAERDLTIVVTTAGVASLAFVTQPSDTVAGQAIRPAVSVRAFTAAGAPAANLLVTIARTDLGLLSGTLSRSTGSTGVAVFDDLSIAAVTGAVMLRATAAAFPAATSIPFNVGLPDLIISSVTHVPAAPTTTDPIEVHAVVTNIGGSPAAPSVLALGLPSQHDGAPTLIPIPGLAPGASYEVVRIDVPQSEGSHHSDAQADAGNNVPELNEGNNTLSDVFDVEEAAGAGLTIFDNVADFASATGATNATGPLPNLGSVGMGAAVGAVTFAPGPGGDTLDIGTLGGGAAPDWYTALPGHDIALGVESLEVQFDGLQQAMGFYFVEPSAATMPPFGGTAGDSLYQVTLYDGLIEVGQFTFNAPDDQVVFVGVSSAAQFDRAVIVDTSGNDDDEYFGEFYAGNADAGAAFVVTNTNDADDGSLREAMLNAEAIPGSNSIVFKIPGAGPHTIHVQSELPVVTAGNPISIDGTTQPGWAGEPIVEIDVQLEGPDVATGLAIQAGDSTVRGLMVNRFADGILLDLNPGNTIIGNWIGLGPGGTTAKGNLDNGVRIADSSVNTIGGDVPLERNVIGGNATGVFMGGEGGGAGSNLILGNYIGTDKTGTAAVPNELGIALWGGAFNTVDGNLISGNTCDEGCAGISVAFGSFNYFRGNIIGLDVTGESALPNRIGIHFGGGDGASTGSVVGGLNAGEGNVIAANPDGNIVVDTLNSDHVIQGNIIGLTRSGAVPVDPQQFGITINFSSNIVVGDLLNVNGRNIIGGNQRGIQINRVADWPGASGNKIHGNRIGSFDGMTATPNGVGIFIFGNRASGNRIEGNQISGNIDALYILAAGEETVSSNVVFNNIIGTAPDFVTALPNATGIRLQANEEGDLTGTVIQGNTIAHNDSTGVKITGDGAVNNKVSLNAIFDNAGLGIDLGFDGVDVNDAGDSDEGPNRRQNAPVITLATTTGNAIGGTLSSRPDTGYTIDLYSNLTCDASGYGEGRHWLGSLLATTNGSGLASFTATYPLALGQVITATATEGLGNTSEFSACRSVDSSLVVSNTNDGGAGSLRVALAAANAAPDLSTLVFAIPGAGPYTIQPGSALPTVTAPLFIDGWSQPGFSGTPLVELDGSSAGLGTDGLVLEGNGNTVRGLAINRFRNGIMLSTSDFNTIEANHLGTDITGLVDRGNARSGIVIDGNDNVIGGLTSDKRNVISGNDASGIMFAPTGTTTENRIEGNYIGVGADGETPIGNGTLGGEFMDDLMGSGIEVNYGPADNAIGGVAPGAANVISGNGTGILVHGAVGAPVMLPVIIRGNLIGTDATGSFAVPNDEGILIENSIPSIAGNVVSGNNFIGIDYVTTALTHVTGGAITGNKIGVAADGTTAIANGSHGVRFRSSAGNTIDQVLVDQNTIAANIGKGIVLTDSIYTTGVSILGNAIYDNGGQGIDLGDDGSDMNDEDDTDEGPNNRQNRPYISIASPETGVVEGALSSVASTSYRIQVFKTPVCETFLGGRDLLSELVLVSDSVGDLSFSVGGLTFDAGEGITATATDPDGNTSEFSPCFEAAAGSLDFLNFEDHLNDFAEVAFPAFYRSIIWTGWKHKAPYPPIEVSPASGVNAIFAAGDGASFAFSETVFLGAWFSVPILNPDLTNPPDDQLYFELYYGGMLVHTSAAITGATGGPVFLAADYFDLVDEVRVRTTGVAMMTPQGSVWIMDDVTFHDESTF